MSGCGRKRLSGAEVRGWEWRAERTELATHSSYSPLQTISKRLERASAAASKRHYPAAAAASDKAWRDQRPAYHHLRNRKRKDFCMDMFFYTVAANASSPREFWRVGDQSTNCWDRAARCPPVSDAVSVDVFQQFFIDKIDAVRATTAANSPPPSFTRLLLPFGNCRTRAARLRP